MRKPSILCK